MSEAVSAPPTISPDWSFATLWRKLTLTERNFLLTAAITTAIIALFYLGHYIEREVLHRAPSTIRFIPQAAEAAMRYVGIPHVIIGFLFMASAQRNKNMRRRFLIALLLGAGAMLSTGFYMGGGKANIVLYAGVYLYFLVHELRDESNFVFILGDSPKEGDVAALRRLIVWMIALIVIGLIALSWSGVPFGAFYKKFNESGSSLADLSFSHSPLVRGALAMPVKLMLSLTPLAAVAAAFVIVLRDYARILGFAEVWAMIRRYHVLFRIIVGVVMVLMLSLVVTGRPHTLALFHFVAWYVFASYTLTKFPPKTPPTGWWQWMRSTAAGFKTLHIGLVVLLMAVAMYWTLALDPRDTSSWFTRLLAPAAFPYWTIMHITVSFVPR